MPYSPYHEARTTLEQDRLAAEQRAAEQRAKGLNNNLLAADARGRSLVDTTAADARALQQRESAAGLEGSAINAGNVGGMYLDMAQRPSGVSPGQQTLMTGAQAARDQTTSLAASGRGLGAAANMRAAAMANQATGAQTAQASDVLAAQEEAMFRQRELAALSGASGAYDQSAGLFGQAGDVYTSARATDLGQQQTLLDEQRANDLAALGYEEAAIGRDKAAAGYISDAGTREDTRYASAVGQLQTQQAIAQQERDRRAAADAARRASYLEGGAQIAGGVSQAYSDERLKEDIEPAEAVEALSEAGSWSYRYKDPAHGPADEYIGPMAQELERTRLGKSLIVETPAGKAVDTGRLALVAASAISEQQREIDALKATVEALRG